MDSGRYKKRKIVLRVGISLKEKACKNCHMMSLGNVCPNCKSTNLSDDWTGLIIILDAENSEIAKKANVNSSGKYAIRVR